MAEKTLAVDFDGVISSYDEWRGKGVFGEPVKEVRRYLEKLRDQGWTIIIHTTRLEVHLIREYLMDHQIPFHHVNHNPANIAMSLHPFKPKATVYLDDRGLTFDGDWEEAYNKILNFEVWYRK